MPAPLPILLVLVLSPIARTASAADPIATCEKKKLVAAARATAGMVRCAARAAASGEAVDAGCLALAASQLTAQFLTADTRGPCPTTGTQGVVSGRGQALAEDLLTSVGGGAPSTCARRKLVAAGKRAQRRLQAEGRHATRPERELLGPRLAVIARTFAADIAKAELADDCGAVGDGPSIAAAVDTAAAAIVDAVRPSLRALAEARGISIGAAVRNAPLSANEAGYADTVVRQFDSVTPEFQFMWGNIEPVQGVLNLGPLNVVVDFAEAHGLALMGTPLVWHLILPPWVNAAMTPAALETALTTRIQTLLGSYGDRVDSWVVVNEALEENGTLRPSIFLQKLGSGYIAQAFHLARAADPDALLFINDYGVEGTGDKADGLYALVTELQQQGVPIDGVGFQMHAGGFFGIPSKAGVQANIQRFTQLGLVVRITEMDLQTRFGFPSERRGKLAYQRQYYRELVEACVEMPGCVGVDFWGFTDKHTWINDFLFLADEPLLFDVAYLPKAAFFGVRDALLAPWAVGISSLP
jgi:endo-1,4-beta-xylanase